jgi:hypothetical protein
MDVVFPAMILSVADATDVDSSSEVVLSSPVMGATFALESSSEVDELCDDVDSSLEVDSEGNELSESNVVVVMDVLPVLSVNDVVSVVNGSESGIVNCDGVAVSELCNEVEVEEEIRSFSVLLSLTKVIA